MPAERTRWEYIIERARWNGNPPELFADVGDQRLINILGEEGWELVNVLLVPSKLSPALPPTFPTGFDLLYYFKRPKADGYRGDTAPRPATLPSPGSGGPRSLVEAARVIRERETD